MKKEYTISGLIGIVLVAMILGSSLLTQDFRDLLAENPEQNIFLIDYDENSKIEILTRTVFPECEFGLIRISDTEVKFKCGSRIAGVYSTWTEYWRTYGKKVTGEEAWWQRNNRKPSLIDITYVFTDSAVYVTRTTPFYKGRSGSDGVLTEEFVVSDLGVKITSDYVPTNNAIHRIIFREDVKSDYISFDSYDPLGNFVRTEKDLNGRDLHVYGEKRGKLKVDPTITIIFPEDKGGTAFVEGNTIWFELNATDNNRDQVVNASIFFRHNQSQGFVNVTFNATGSGLLVGDNATSLYLNETFTLPNYIDTWPYGWYVEYCMNTTRRDVCKTTTPRLIASNVNPILTGSPSVSVAIASDSESISCNITESQITATSRIGRFSVSDGITNGVINMTWYLNDGASGFNITTIPNSRNLTEVFSRGTHYNNTKGQNISCSVILTDGLESSNLELSLNGAIVSNGTIWDEIGNNARAFNITTPDEDFNVYDGGSDDKDFDINWTMPSNFDNETNYISIFMDNILTGDQVSIIENLTVANNYEGAEIKLNLSTYNAEGIDGRLNTVMLPLGNYKANLTICEINWTGHPGSGNCISRRTENTIDVLSMNISFGPGVSTFRIDPPGDGSALGLKPAGQTSSVGIFQYDTSALGDMDLSIGMNSTYGSGCKQIWCSNSSLKSRIYDNPTTANAQGFNMSNASSVVIDQFSSYSGYVWCWVDYFSCTAGVVDSLLFEFDLTT